MGSKGAKHGKVTVGGKAAARWNGGRPSRAADLAEATREVPQRTPARKDTKRWCRGKVGVEHVPVIVYRPWYDRYCHAAGDWERDLWPAGWVCQHREECNNCGRVLRQNWKLKPEECPGYPQQEVA